MPITNRYNEIPSGDVDGINKDFVASRTPDYGTLEAYLNGLYVFSTISGATVTFVDAPEIGDTVSVTYTYTTPTPTNTPSVPGYTGPLQPMSAALQENFRQMVDHVLSYNPDCPVQLVKRRLNTRMRELQDRRMWGGLLVRGELMIPAVYTTGLVSTTRGSKIVTSNGTGWPYNDLVNTTTTSAAAGGIFQDIRISNMDGIYAGDWLNLDDATTAQEDLLVIATKPTSITAIPKFSHGSGTRVYKSSLTRRQFRVGITKPFYNIVGVNSDLHLHLDQPYADSSAADVGYQIVQAYVQMGPYLRMVWSVVNNAQGWRLRLNMPQEVINVYDSWRATQGWVYMLNDYVPDEIGRMQYELYPTPTMEQAFPYLAYRTIPNLENDYDTPPPCIPSHLLVHGAIADVMMLNRKSSYYDPQIAQKFESQFELDLAAAALADDAVYMNALQWTYSAYPFTQHGASYWASHDMPPYDS